MGEEDIVRVEATQIANEFALVLVRKVHTRDGERLEIESPKLGYKIRLDALELESFTWQEPSVFSKFLKTPFGPENSSNAADGQ